MGSWCQLEAAVVQPVLQSGVWSLHPWHHDRAVAGMQQRKVIGRISQSQNSDFRCTLALLQHRQGPAFADVRTQQMAQAISLHNRKLTGLRKLLQTPAGLGIHCRHERHAAGPTLGLSQCLPAKAQQAISLLITEIIKRLQRLS